MKKIVFFLMAAVAAVSCAEGTYSTEYVLCSTFEYSNIDYDAVFGSDSTFFDDQNKVGIGWGDIAFQHKVSESDAQFKGGFMLSYLKASGMDEKPEDFVSNRYRVAGPVVKGAEKNVYVVFCQSSEMPEHDVTFMQTTYGTFTASHCFVNNTEAVYQAVKKNFKEGDELKLIATGYKAGQVTATAEIKLAADTVMYNWTLFDLKKLESVEHIDFSLVSTNPAVPTDFCLDELQGKVAIAY